MRGSVRVGAGGRLVVEVDAATAAILQRLGVLAVRHLADRSPGWRASHEVSDALASLQAVISAAAAAGPITSTSRSSPGSAGEVLGDCITAGEAAALLGTSARWVAQLAESGELPARRSTAGWLLYRPAVIRLAIERKVS